MRSAEFTKNALKDFIEWEATNMATFRKIGKLIKETLRILLKGKVNQNHSNTNFQDIDQKELIRPIDLFTKWKKAE